MIRWLTHRHTDHATRRLWQINAAIFAVALARQIALSHGWGFPW